MYCGKWKVVNYWKVRENSEGGKALLINLKLEGVRMDGEASALGMLFSMHRIVIWRGYSFGIGLNAKGAMGAKV